VNRPVESPVKTFAVVRNPEADSSLPFLVRIPLDDGDLILKTRDSWPRTAKVYCHRAEDWPPDAAIIEEVPVRSCARRGVAVDLILDRSRENRSQFVFTKLAGRREGIFWQSARTTRKARPAYRMPTGRPAGLDDLHILIDTRERYPHRFARQQCCADLTRWLVDGQLAYALAELATLDRAGRGRRRRPIRRPPQRPARPPRVPRRSTRGSHRPLPNRADHLLRHATTRRRWTFRFLAAALTYLQADRG